MKTNKHFHLSIILLVALSSLYAIGYCGGKYNSALKEILSQEVKSYISTHGKTLDSTLFTPYASEYCEIEKISTNKIVKELFGSIPNNSSDDEPQYISSHRYLCGNWTHILSSSVCFYEVIKIKDTLTNQIYIAVLHNSPRTDEPLRLKGWHLSVFNDQFDLIQSVDLEKKSPFRFVSDEDMIYTDLEIENGNILAVITYTMTGSGGSPEKGYSFTISVLGNNVKLVKSSPIKRW
jgi:hypothetical protein